MENRGTSKKTCHVTIDRTAAARTIAPMQRLRLFSLRWFDVFFGSRISRLNATGEPKNGLNTSKI